MPLFCLCICRPNYVTTEFNSTALTLENSCTPSMLHASIRIPRRSYYGTCWWHILFCLRLPTPSDSNNKIWLRWMTHLQIIIRDYYYAPRWSTHLSIMSTHGSIALQWASGIAVTGVWKRVVLYFIIPGLHKLQNGPISAKFKPCENHIIKWHKYIPTRCKISIQIHTFPFVLKGSDPEIEEDFEDHDPKYTWTPIALLSLQECHPRPKT